MYVYAGPSHDDDLIVTLKGVVQDILRGLKKGGMLEDILFQHASAFARRHLVQIRLVLCSRFRWPGHFRAGQTGLEVAVDVTVERAQDILMGNLQDHADLTEGKRLQVADQARTHRVTPGDFAIDVRRENARPPDEICHRGGMHDEPVRLAYGSLQVKRAQRLGVCKVVWAPLLENIEVGNARREVASVRSSSGR